MQCFIIESVDSISGDGPDTPIYAMQHKNLNISACVLLWYVWEGSNAVVDSTLTSLILHFAQTIEVSDAIVFTILVQLKGLFCVGMELSSVQNPHAKSMFYPSLHHSICPPMSSRLLSV